jgi:hypothetical protein
MSIDFRKDFTFDSARWASAGQAAILRTRP